MKLDIPNPCTEKWEGMKPVEEGAFCSVCNKNVVDFSEKTSTEIKLSQSQSEPNGINLFARSKRR